jgi:hypothetical protein
MTFEIPTDKEPTRGMKFIFRLYENIFLYYLAQITNIKDKFNVTTTVRTRKDKVGKVNIVFYPYSLNCKFILVSHCSITRIQY